MCYEVSISWNWPLEGEANETWNFYRTEQRPSAMDLSLLQPILSTWTILLEKVFSTQLAVLMMTA